MSTDYRFSASNLADTMPPSEPQSTTPALTEAQLYAKQAQQAKYAMTRSLRVLGRALSPVALTKRHPWVSLGAALAGGAIAGATVGKRSDKSKPVYSAAHSADQKPRQPSALSILMGHLAGAIGPVIAQVVRQAVMPTPPPAHGSNGHAEVPPEPVTPPPT